jgi:eukaryotic-like serine/threonine-protein kinase
MLTPALGVLLYELLTGSPPFTREDLQQKGLLEVLRVIREDDPPRPSFKLSTARGLATLAANRSTEPKKLTGQLRNELDWIVMKALEKDRSRRYATANGLAADIERFLAGEDVQAVPPSRVYRLQKFVRRHKVQVLAAGLVFVALIVGMIGTTLGLLEAQRQSVIAREQEFKAKEQETLALKQAEIAREEAAAKEQARAEEARQRAIADDQRKKVEEEKLIVLAVRDFLQNKLLAQADPKQQANSLIRGGGRSSETKPNPTIRELLDRAAKELSPERIEASIPKQPLIQAEILQTVGLTYHGLGEIATALGFLERAETLFRKQLGDDHIYTLVASANVGVANHELGKLDKAIPMLEKTLAHLKSRFGTDHYNTVGVMNSLALAYRDDRKPDLALPLFKEALAWRKSRLGPDHLDTLIAINNLAGAYVAQNKVDLAMGLLEELLQRYRATVGLEHPSALSVANNLATAYMALGQYQKSLKLYQEAFPLTKAKLGDDHPLTRGMVSNMALLQRIQEAAQLYEQAVEDGTSQEINAILALRDIAHFHLFIGQIDLAEQQLVEALAGLVKRDPNDQILIFTINLLQSCLSIREKTNPDNWQTFNTMSTLGGVQLTRVNGIDDGSGKSQFLEKIEPLLVKGYEGLKARETSQKVDPTAITQALERLVEFYTISKKSDEAKKYQSERAKYPATKEVAPRPRVKK